MQYTVESLSRHQPSRDSICSHEWAMAAVWPALLLLGVLVQFNITAPKKKEKGL